MRATYHRAQGVEYFLGCVFVILDNLPHVHDHPRFLRLLDRLRITPVSRRRRPLGSV